MNMLSEYYEIYTYKNYIVFLYISNLKINAFILVFIKKHWYKYNPSPKYRGIFVLYVYIIYMIETIKL